MMNRRKFALGVLVVAACFSGLAIAQSDQRGATDKPDVEAEIQQFKVLKDARGRESFDSAASVKPGDEVEYRVSYVNKSGKSVSGAVATLPVPVGLEYTPKSARHVLVRAQFAGADGVYGSEPLLREVRSAGGRVRTEVVPYSEYRSVKWNLGELPAGGSTEVVARMRVSTGVPAAVPGAGAAASAAAPVSQR